MSWRVVGVCAAAAALVPILAAAAKGKEYVVTEARREAVIHIYVDRYRGWLGGPRAWVHYGHAWLTYPHSDVTIHVTRARREE